MARNTTKKATTKAKAPAPAPEATTMPEAHLDPAQLGSMDDASLQQLARDMGLDPAAYPDREALTAAIAEVPVIPGPPEPDGQEGQETPQEQPAAQQGQDDAPQGQDGQGSGQDSRRQQLDTLFRIGRDYDRPDLYGFRESDFCFLRLYGNESVCLYESVDAQDQSENI